MPVLRDDDGRATTSGSSSQIGNMEAEWERLRAERENFERMKAAFEAERNRDPQPIARDEANQGQINHENVVEQFAAVVSNVQQIHIDIKIPKFKDETEKHPMEFIEELEKYMKTKNVKEVRKMSVVEHALEGKADLWFNLRENFMNYEDFKEQFIEEFYSIPIRVRFKKKWMEERYEASRESLQIFFYKQLGRARYFIPRLSEFELNYNIVQQFPNWVRETLSTINFTDTNAIVQTLGNLDVVRKDRTWENRTNHHNNSQHKQNAPRINQTRIQGGNHQSRGRRDYGWNNNNRYNNRRDHRNDRGYANTRNENFDENRPSFRMPDTRFPPPEQTQYNASSNPNGENRISNNNTLN